MKTFKIIISVPVLLLLTSCATGKDTVVTMTEVKRSYPELPDVKPLPPLNLLPFEWDYPRDMSKVVPKSTKKCFSIPIEERKNAYWDQCGENPPLLDSNIFMGLDSQSFKTMQINMEKIKARLLQYKARIEEINKQRAEWRSKAESERDQK